MEATPGFSKLHRALHWLIALAMSGLYLTGFLRMTWMDKKHMAGIISDTTGGSINADEAVVIAKAIREPMWEWHVVFAVMLTVFFFARIIYMMVKGPQFPSPLKKELGWKQRVESSSYVLFYIFVAFNVFSGFYHLWGPSGPFKGTVTGIHKWALYWFPLFLIIHFTGIAIGEHGKKKGIVSKIIGGE